MKSVPGFNAMADGRHYTQLNSENDAELIEVYDLATGKKEKTLFDNTKNLFEGKKINIDDYVFSYDEQ